MKEQIVTALAENLESLVGMLKRDPDPNCRWTIVFEGILERANSCKNTGCTKDDLVGLSHMFVGIARPFFDYGGPAIFDEQSGRYFVIHGTENFQKVAEKVFELAEELRITGTY